MQFCATWVAVLLDYHPPNKMLIFDQLKKDDPRMRVVAGIILSGFSLLLGGLWWVQIVSSRDYK